MGIIVGTLMAVVSIAAAIAVIIFIKRKKHKKQQRDAMNLSEKGKDTDLGVTDFTWASSLISPRQQYSGTSILSPSAYTQNTVSSMLGIHGLTKGVSTRAAAADIMQSPCFKLTMFRHRPHSIHTCETCFDYASMYASC